MNDSEDYSVMKSPEEMLGRLQTVTQTMEKLIEIASDDKQITDEEKALLFSVNANIEKYAKMVIEAISDNKVTPEELTQIEALENTIVVEAKEIANQDRAISADEQNLLDTLITAFQNL